MTAAAPARAPAEQSVASRFSRVMNATTSPFGVLTDPPVIALATAVLFVAWLAAHELRTDPALVSVLEALAAAPVALAVGTSLALLGARRRVVAWLDGLPFPLENVNALLNGLGESLEVTFAAELPASAALNEELDRVHPDAFVTKTSPETRVVEVRIGVLDSKRNPAASNHRRYVRVQALVGRVLLPLSERHPVIEVRVK